MNRYESPISVTHPELAAQADGWDPTTLTAGSGIKVGWRCEQDHLWSAIVASRKKGKGCPFCSNKQVLDGFNDLATTNPELALQADGWDPTTLTAHSGIKVGWKCEQGHTWSTTVDRRSAGVGCPICSSRQVLAGFNDLATTNPKLAAQADGWDASTVTAGSDKRRAWKCHDGHTWTAVVGNRARGSGCPVCSSRQVLAGFNDLATSNPELALQVDGWDPTTLTAHSGKKVRWRCEQGHTWKTTVASRSSGSGCPVCVNQLVLIGYNDLATTNPELAAQAFDWDPTTLTAHSNKKVSWRCEQGHKWHTSPNRRSSGIGCAVCSNQQVLAGFNDLATTNPELAAQAFDWDPTTLTAGSSKKAGWKCEKGHTWSAAVASRLTGVGCPICSNKQVLAGLNDLATVNPELAAEADGWDPTTLSAFSNKIVGWRCRYGHTWSAHLSNRSKGHGCPICANRIVLAGFNDLATTNPELAAQADGWNPTTISHGSNKKVKWRCKFNHTWTAPVTSRSLGRGCPSCTPTGFSPSQDGWLYLLEHDDLDMYQIGISNAVEKRITQHKKRDWEVIEVRGPMEGHLARQLETAILRAIEKRGAERGHKANIEKFDGYTEAWTKDSLSVTSFKQLLDWVYQDDEKKLITKAL